MAVSVTNLSSNFSGSSATSYATDSITPPANNLILLTFESRTGITANPNQPTASGCGLTWVVINSVVYDSDSSSRKRVTLFRAMGASPSTGAVTIDCGGQTQTNATWAIDKATGMDTSGTNGSGAIVQSATNKDETGTATSLTVTLSAFGSSNNATYGTFTDEVSTTSTAGSGFTRLVLVGNESSSELVHTQWRSDNDTTVNITWGTGGKLGGIAIEIKAAATGTNMQLNIGDTFKTVSSMQINVGDSWKSVTHAWINIGDAWKQIF